METFTRKEALEIGSLVDLSRWAEQCNITHPTAASSDVWLRYLQAQDWEDTHQRVLDLLCMLSANAKYALAWPSKPRLEFGVPQFAEGGVTPRFSVVYEPCHDLGVMTLTIYGAV